MHTYSDTENITLSTSKSSDRLRIALIGASGYSGMELGRCLLRHPKVKSLTLIVNETPISPKIWIPEARHHSLSCLTLSQFKSSTSEFDLVFLATPAEVSMEIAPQLLSAKLKVIDLSGAFRLPNSDSYEQWYGFKHTHPDFLSLAHYGLVPFHTNKNPEAISLIANPGCYATAVQMALIPLLKASLIHLDTLVIDAKSGTTGAGKKASETQLFAEVSEDCFAYRIGQHQHFPEIQHYLTQFSNKLEIDHSSVVDQSNNAHHLIDPIFSTTLLPIRRGIIASIYARVKEGVREFEIEQAYEGAFVNYPLVRINSAKTPESKSLLSLRTVVGSARNHITYAINGNKLQIYSNIDNLMKGAATQAIENMNYLNHWPIDTGLTDFEGLI